MKLAVFDAGGFPQAFYAPEIGGQTIPPDAIEISDDQWQEFIDNQGWRRWNGSSVEEYAPPAPVPTIDDYRRAIQAHIDATAQSHNYDSGVTCSSYINSTNPAWAAQAAAFVAWRDAIWAHAFTELAKVEAGTRPQPSIEQIIAELQPMVWPA